MQDNSLLFNCDSLTKTSRSGKAEKEQIYVRLTEVNLGSFLCFILILRKKEYIDEHLTTSSHPENKVT